MLNVEWVWHIKVLYWVGVKRRFTLGGEWVWHIKVTLRWVCHSKLLSEVGMECGTV